MIDGLWLLVAAHVRVCFWLVVIDGEGGCWIVVDMLFVG